MVTQLRRCANGCCDVRLGGFFEPSADVETRHSHCHHGAPQRAQSLPRRPADRESMQRTGEVGYQCRMDSEGTVADAIREVWRRMAAEGRPMPSEGELADQLGASRGHVREQMIRLEADGLVRREHGAGTFVNSAAADLRFRLDRVRDFAVSLREAGFEPTVEVLHAAIVELDTDAADRLDAPAGSDAYETRKRWLADGRPAMVARDVVPVRRAVAASIDPSGSVFELAEQLGRDAADWLETHVSAVLPPPTIAEALSLDTGRPVIRLDQLGWSKQGRRVFLSTDHYHPEIVTFGTVRTVGR
ncbi:MAG: GntR family transcriptional regulator [Ilumatobacter fluminis]|uniref:GntR family transcriptional regulator n=1 Tax=Ilumatobacter fluminis TaxID=467091 RepID=UPI0032EEF4F1